MLLPSSELPVAPSWPAASQRSTRDRIVETLRYLSDEIEARRAGGLGEAQAAGYLAGRLRRANYAATVLSFRTGIGEALPLILVASLGAAAALLAAWATHALAYGVAALCAISALALVLTEIEGAQSLRRRLKGRPSQSVVAVRAAGARLRWRVVVQAPLDGPPRPALARRGLNAVLIALATVLVAIMLLTLTGDPVWRLALAGVALLLAGLAVWIAIRSALPSPLPAIHGAGDLATLLMVAEALEPLSHVEVWIAALGGSTIGEENVEALLDRYPFTPVDTCFINLHAISAGQPVFVTREGMLRERRSDRMLLALADETDAADVSIDAEPRRVQQRTLAQLLLRRGQRAITISSHSDSSPFTSPDADTIERCTRLVAGMIRRLDTEGKGF
jgi:hypothetical protein